MKLAKLMNSSDKMRKINSRFVKVVQFKIGKDRYGLPTAVAKTYTPIEYTVTRRLQPARDQNRYVSSIKFLDRALNVKVSCSCPDYCFRFEVANHEAGASDIKYSNGEMPTTTNADMQPGLCKHLIALRKIVKDKYNV